jgi:hypothetical protein
MQGFLTLKQGLIIPKTYFKLFTGNGLLKQHLQQERFMLQFVEA